MSNKRAKAEELVAASTRNGSNISADNRERIVGALTEDLREASGRRRVAVAQAASVEERLLNIEARLRVLTDAVNALTTVKHA